ncbi:stage II sporulation protein R [Candidatus Contubernalis alkaliaceticus]|uniref:stage II sporulation protein R n=1 Tax=Candidatus Contubernalis alkaliaceticus TaxID=338645 RepID=UPI001F4BE90E|nr:stage II sporulation protein R [Candidatus Contubernalis alkalaceticus]UNC93680.1 stage II sporulation protein R [Candidatus Contubernalis alkalaceticus]
MRKTLWIFILLALMAFQGYHSFFTESLSGSVPEEQQIIMVGGESLDKEEALRFHVVAHSDEPRDQEIKEQVTREVLVFMADRLKEAETKEQARELLKEKMPLIQALVEQELETAGTPHGVEISLEQEIFPSRQYIFGEFPAGEYEALRIVIGSGAGENWWCVLFPPLCFNHLPEDKQGKDKDSIKGILDSRCTEDSLQGSKEDSLNQTPCQDSSNNSTENEGGEVEVRFRVVEWVNNLLPSYYGFGRRD